MTVGDDGDMWETHAVNRLLARVRGVVWRMSRGSGSRMAQRMVVASHALGDRRL